MRLTCPNCDAQYEVPDEVIPKSGRDVQCSNCGQTWFQDHPDYEAEVEEAESDPSIPTPDEEISPAPPPSAPVDEPKPEPARKELDPAIAEILRQEAEAERAAREDKRDKSTLESQPDLGLDTVETVDDVERRAQEAKARMARIRGKDAVEPPHVSEAAATAAALGSRRDLLPDIEEINSTLRSTSDRDGSLSDGEVDVEAPTRQRKKRGFRTGFLVVLLLAVVLVCVYVFAPAIINAVPALENWMIRYVSAVDQGRVWLDVQLQTFLKWLEQVASNSESG